MRPSMAAYAPASNDAPPSVAALSTPEPVSASYFSTNARSKT
jgi:hypothetical protein